MGVVYEAFDRVDGRHVAIKTLGRVDATAIYRIKKEFRALADVSHPNLVGLHELVCHEDRWFYVMELVDGVDLLKWVHRRGRGFGPDPSSDGSEPTWVENRAELFSEEDTGATEIAVPVEEPRPKRRGFASIDVVDMVRLRESFAQLTEGLTALHDVGKLHRDIKPSNVLVTDTGRVVLLDFGLATELSERALIQSSAQGLVCGTIAYMSPEQGAGGEKLEPASDFYAIGVMLFEALTGRLPFEGEVYKVLVDKQRLDAPGPRELVPDVPPQLDDLCRRLLSRDPTQRPVGSEIRKALGAPSGVMTPAASWPVQIVSGPFVGRRQELAALEQAFEHVRTKGTSVVLIEGASGIGKSTMLEHFVDGLVERDEAVVLSGRCYERELVPFKAVDSLIDALTRFLRTLPIDDAESLLPNDIRLLARVFPVLERVEAIGPRRRKEKLDDASSELRTRAFAALRELLSRIAMRVPLVLALDDLHWGDADSGYLLVHLLAPPKPPPLLLVSTFRTEERDQSAAMGIVTAGLMERGRGALFTHVELGHLEIADAKELALSLLTSRGLDGAIRTERAETIAEESRGNPLFVYGLVESAARDDPTRARALLLAQDEGTPMRRIRLESVLYDRAQQLPEEARTLLEVVAAAAAPLRVSIANRAAGLDRGDRSAAALLRSHRLVRTSTVRDADTIEIAHSRIRDAVFRHVGPEKMKAHHRALADLLTQDRDSDPVVLVHHLREAGDAESAGRYARRAASIAFESLAFERAAELFRLAIELDPTRHTHTTRAWLGEALAKAGHAHEAADAYLEAAKGAPEERGLDLVRRAGEQLLTSGHVDRSLEVLQELLPRLSLRYPATPRSAMRAVTMWRAALALRGLHFTPRAAKDCDPIDLVRIDVCSALCRGFALIDMVRAAYFGTKRLSLALSAGEPHRLVRALGFEVVIVGGIDRNSDRADETLEAQEKAAALVKTPVAEGSVKLSRGFMAFVRGRWAEAEDELTAAQKIFDERCSGVFWELHTCQVLVSEAMAQQGRLAELNARVRAQLEAAEAADDLFTATATRTFPLHSLTWLAADRPDIVREHIADAMSSWTERAYNFEHYAAMASLVQADLYEGLAEDAWSRVVDHWPRLEESQFTRVHLVAISTGDLYVRAGLAVLARDKDDKKVMSAVSSRLKAVRDINLPHVAPLVALHRGQLSVLRDKPESAVSWYREACAGFEAQGMRIQLAVCWYRLAELVEPAEASELRARAQEIFEAEQVVDPAKLVRVFAPVGA